ncbi:MAG: nucleotidyl transferase AbiEii/AbiGii toxin family protein [Bacteroides sp.]|nr:nucleotidyl transferase AbiEii/AbiGii toxin family protein [Bacteroides sp.]MCM1555853.1 nucleotidyl transferase AbiEii/AbiGii toxin family protein [Bacteroides sp.]
MIDLKYIGGFFPDPLRANPAFAKHIIKEYIQLTVLDYLSSTPHIKKMAFIGGTNLRLVKGIDRFSEDLDFDVHGMPEREFLDMTDDVLSFLRHSGLNVEARDKQNERLSAFRRNIHFPQLLFDLKLTGHKEERFLLKIEAQDQRVAYEPVMVNVRGCGFFFPLPVPPDSVLLSMKLSALLARAKGRDFYDVMFLFPQTEPDYGFLERKTGIGNLAQLKAALQALLAKTDLNAKKRDFGHLLFSERNAEKILRFGDFISGF